MENLKEVKGFSGIYYITIDGNKQYFYEKENSKPNEDKHKELTPNIRFKTKYAGVFYRVNFGKEKLSKVYYISYKDKEGRRQEKKVKAKNDGDEIKPEYCKQIREEITYKLRTGQELPELAKRKNKTQSFEDVWLFFANNKKMGDRRRIELRGRLDKKTNEYKNGIWNTHLKAYFSRGVTFDKLKEFYEKKKSELAPKTLHMRITEVGTAINYWNDEGKGKIKNDVQAFKKWLSNNETEEQKQSKKIERLRFLSDKEVFNLKKSLEDKHPDLKLFTAIALSTGARLESILTIKKIDIQGRKVSIINHKRGGRIYTGFLNDECISLLEEKLEKLKPTDTFFELEKRQVQRRLQWILDKLFNDGLDTKDSQNRIVLHSLRHSFASKLVMNGVPLIKVRDLLDHKEIKTTERYAKLAPGAGMDDVLNMWS